MEKKGNDLKEVQLVQKLVLLITNATITCILDFVFVAATCSIISILYSDDPNS